MPLPEVLALLGAGQSVGNMILQGDQNKRNRNFAREQYYRQRQDALADWNMQNEYNSPRSQMQRYQEAGLNPNLIYGQMQTAQPVRQSSASGSQGEAPQLRAAEHFMQMYDLQRTSAQTDLLEKQVKVAEEEAKLKGIQGYATLINAGLGEAKTKQIMYDMGYKEEFRPISMDTKKAQLENIKAQTAGTVARTQFTLDENERQRVMLQPNLERQLEEIARIKVQNRQTALTMQEIQQRIENLKKDGKLKDYEINLNQKGIQKGDKLYMRKLLELWSEISGAEGKPARGAVREAWKNSPIPVLPFLGN